MLDLQLLAFQSDLTRVISFMIGKENHPYNSQPRRVRSPQQHPGAGSASKSTL